MNTNRQPAGTSVGGQWAPGASGEVEDSLDAPVEATGLGYRDMSIGQTERFDSRTWVSKTGNGLAVLTLDDDGEGTTTRYYVSDDRAADDSHLGDSHADEVASQLYGGRGLSRVDHTERGLTGDSDDFEDPWRVNSHLITWAPASQGRVSVEFGDDRMREIGAGGHRFADSEKMEVANNFITAYDQDAILARRIPPLTDEQRQARIDVIRTTNDEFDMNQAADDLELDDRLHRAPFDSTRPPLHAFDPSSPASHEAVSKSDNGANVFAHTSDLDGTITQVFSLVEDHGRMKTKTERFEK